MIQARHPFSQVQIESTPSDSTTAKAKEEFRIEAEASNGLKTMHQAASKPKASKPPMEDSSILTSKFPFFLHLN